MDTVAPLTSAAVIVVLSLAGVAACLDWLAVTIPRWARLEYGAKPAVPLFLAAAALVAPGVPGTTRWIDVAALLFCCVGDVALMVPERPGGSLFLVGLGSFLVAQVLFAIAFVRLPHSSLLVAAGVLLVLMVAPATLVVRSVRRHDATLMAPVCLYIAAIAMMAAAALAAGHAMTSLGWLPMVGGLSFVVSDLLLAINRFVRPLPHEAVLVHLTYHVAIGALGVGLLVAGA